MGGKVLVPTREAVQKLIAARLAADVCGVPTLLVARTDANGAQLLTSDVDDNDKPFCTGETTIEGFHRIQGGIDIAIARGLAYAPYCDLIWCETSEPNFAEAEKFATAIHAKFPGKLLAYNCSPSFNWKSKLNDEDIASFQYRLGDMGYKFQFVTLAGFHALNLSMFELATAYKRDGMFAYSALQQREFAITGEAMVQSSTSASSVPATSTWSRPPSQAAKPAPMRWPARPKKSSSSMSPCSPTSTQILEQPGAPTIATVARRDRGRLT